MLFRRPHRGVRNRNRWAIRLAIAAVIIANLLAYIGAYAMTHILPPGKLGVGMPRPLNRRLPSALGLAYRTERIAVGADEWLETWRIPVARPATARGTVILFPGNRATKSQLLSIAKRFHHLNYDCLLVDYRGIGGSSGNTTTIGKHEARDVVAAMQYIRQGNPQQPIVLYGVSMGSAAILTAIASERIAPTATILELPYARLVDAVRSRVSARHLPTFPIAELLVLWGGIQHGFNGFAHNPVDYARKVDRPTLILLGKQDKWTSPAQVKEIFDNLQGNKQMVTFDRAGHNALSSIDPQLWNQSVTRFLNNVAVGSDTQSQPSNTVRAGN